LLKTTIGLDHKEFEKKGGKKAKKERGSGPCTCAFKRSFRHLFIENVKRYPRTSARSLLELVLWIQRDMRKAYRFALRFTLNLIN